MRLLWPVESFHRMRADGSKDQNIPIRGWYATLRQNTKKQRQDTNTLETICIFSSNLLLEGYVHEICIRRAFHRTAESSYWYILALLVVTPKFSSNIGIQRRSLFIRSWRISTFRVHNKHEISLTQVETEQFSRFEKNA